jgi:RimK family alpha-L-glutamate ligase
MRKFDLDIILFTNGPGAYAPKRLLEEAVKHNINLRIIKYNDINISYSEKGVYLNLRDEKMPIAKAVILRGIGEDSLYNPIRTAITTWFESKGTKILNQNSIDKWPSLDKTTQHINYVSNGIPVVESFSFTAISDLKKWSENAYPYIAKDIIGSSGEGVFKIAGISDLTKLLEKFNSNIKIKTLLFQRFLPNARDLRIIVLGGKIIGAMKRTALPGNFLSNYSQGGKVEPYEIEKDIEANRIALDVARLFKLDYCGVDLMKNAKGEWVVLEVNRACQFEGFEQSTKINVASKIIDFLII